MKKYYITFGTGPRQLFQGGWVIVTAESRSDAVEKFIKQFGPDATIEGTGLLRFGFMYDEEDFKMTMMHENNDNCGAALHAEF